jgi:hypothetical protein
MNSVLEADAVPGSGAGLQIAAAARACGRLLQVFEQIRQIQIVLVEAADRRQRGAHRGLTLAKQHEIHGHLTHAHGAEHGFRGDPPVAAVQRRGAEQPQAKAPRIATQSQVTVFAIQPREYVAIAVEKTRTQFEQFHFLRRVFARQHRFQIGLHARLRGTPAKQAERLAGEFRLGQERRQSRRDQEHHSPGREADQKTAEGQQRDRILHQPEGAHDQAQRAARGFAARARQFVVELRILELSELQGQRLFQDHDIDTLPELRAQQRLRQGNAALCHRRERDQECLESDETQHRVEGRRAGLSMQIGGMDDRIDDLRADKGDARRQHPGEHRQYCERDAECFVGGPNQLERPPAIGEQAEQTALQAARLRRGQSGCRCWARRQDLATSPSAGRRDTGRARRRSPGWRQSPPEPDSRCRESIEIRSR